VTDVWHGAFYLPTNRLHASKKDTENGMEKDFDTKIQNCFDITDEDVCHQGNADCGNVPRKHGRKHMHKYFDRIDSS
jgi:hypothetical protein